jgi:hypothetical protein
MPNYSHRDHRSYRAAYRLLALVAGGTVALVAVVFVAPWAAIGELALLALAALGGAALWESSAIADAYADDHRRAGRAGAAPSMLHVEVQSRLDLERSVFVGARPSPHARRPRVEPPSERAGGLATGELA